VISISKISDKKTRAFTSDLCNNTFLHTIITLTGILALTLDLLSKVLTTQETFVTNKSKQYNSLRFFGIMIDTSVSAKSTIGYNQYLVYCTIIYQILIDKTTESTISIKFSIGTISSIGSIEIISLIKKTKFYIILANIFFLLLIADIDRLKTYLNNTYNILVTPQGEVVVVC
jgi:hypothetical protein